MKFICYKKCTTCQKAQRWLDDSGYEYEIRDYSNLYAAIDKLPEKLKICISLKYFSNLSCAEISSILEISVSAVTTRLSRAIKVLAKEMNKGE